MGEQNCPVGRLAYRGVCCGAQRVLRVADAFLWVARGILAGDAA